MQKYSAIIQLVLRKALPWKSSGLAVNVNIAT